LNYDAAWKQEDFRLLLLLGTIKDTCLALGAWCLVLKLIVVESLLEAEAAWTLTLDARSYRADKEIAKCSTRLSQGRRQDYIKASSIN